jgi:hypothetical protein
MNHCKDKSFDIATGRSRKENHWKNKKITWNELVEKLRKTHRTAETRAEYASAKKEQQDEIKDIGGFVGGFITGGRRLKGNILHRQLITLDIDFATSDFWEKFGLCFPEEAAVVYSTHKHTPDKPRLRLIMPLNKPVTPDQYQAISRRIAGILGIEIFDYTTFEPHRLMYWPSTSKDGEYVFEEQQGKCVNADKILGTYRDWTDESQWPVSVRTEGKISRGLTNQADPLKKKGIIGAFCRARTIQETIEKYLSEVYSPAGDNCYTYIEGSTTGGLKIYADKFAYSHHSTDPASGKLCNAFDLVRIHKFGSSTDKGTPEGTPPEKMPSFLAMMELVKRDDRVEKELKEEKLAQAKVDFQRIFELGGNDIANLFTVKTAAEWIDQARKRPIPKMLFGEFWFEGELCILFADTNLGKSIAAVQIANSISKGESIKGFKLEAAKQHTLYFDFELSEKQFENRYSEKYKDHYCFDENLLRVEINPDAPIPENISFEEFLNSSFEKAIIETGAKVLIVDNITYLKNETEKAKDALPLMKYLKRLKSKYGLSILALAHTPKRDLSKPITRNDLQGSKMLINFCDSSFAIGESSKDTNIRYFKQIKSRNTEIIYDAENVCVCQIVKPRNFLQFEFLDFGRESEHLKQLTDMDKENLKDKVYELRQQGQSTREIALEVGISHMTVSRILMQMQDNLV